MTVIILVGLARSGKDTAADYLVQKHGFTKYTFSDVLKELLEQKGITSTKKRMNELGDILRNEMGMAAIAKMLDKKINKKDKLVFVGPRSIEEIDYFKKKFPELKIIKITTGKDERFGRRSEEDPSEKEEFHKRDEDDKYNKGFQKVLDSADFQVNNFSEIENFYSELETVLNLVQSE
ncbi:MAG: AAA family ATPase [archaeon]|nr:AAA family ATPase [archaeon]